MSGIEVAGALRQRGFARPIVLFSAHLKPELNDEVRQLDMTPISKVDHNALFRVVERYAAAG